MKFYIVMFIMVICMIAMAAGALLPVQYAAESLWLMAGGAAVMYLNALFIVFILQKDLSKDSIR